MQQSNRPAKFLTPFAQGDTGRAEIPLTTPDSTRASQTLGFPPLTGTPPEAGGVPPQREDMNGALNQMARLPWWAALGGRFPYDAAFATNVAINGYPSGAVLPSALGLGDWISTADNNTNDPDTVTASWVPGYHYGSTVLVGQVGGAVVLDPSQAAKRLLVVSGTLSSNLTITVPAWVYNWDVVNNTAGAFTVTVRTPTAGGTVVPQNGVPVRLIGDGTNIVVATQTIPAASNTTAGIQRNATNAEVTAGTTTNLTVTPAGLAAVALRRNQNLLDLGNIPAARNNLGLGTVATMSEIVVTDVTGLSSQLSAKLNVNNPTGSGTMSGVSGYQFDGGQGYIYRSGDGISVRYGTAAASKFAFFDANGNFRVTGGAVTASGGFQDSSSRTVKEHLAYITPTAGLAAVLGLRAARYRYVWDSAQRLGYYAEDVQLWVPEAVKECSEENISPLAIEDTQMLPHHTAAVQALYAMITELQAKVAKLEHP